LTLVRKEVRTLRLSGAVALPCAGVGLPWWWWSRCKAADKAAGVRSGRWLKSSAGDSGWAAAASAARAAAVGGSGGSGGVAGAAGAAVGLGDSTKDTCWPQAAASLRFISPDRQSLSSNSARPGNRGRRPAGKATYGYLVLS
jgi:hypothetical protein